MAGEWTKETKRKKRALMRRFFKTAADRGLTDDADIAKASGITTHQLYTWRIGRHLPKRDEDVETAIALLKEIHATEAAAPPPQQPDLFPDSGTEIETIGRGIEMLEGLEPGARRRVLNYWNEKFAA